MSRIMVLRVIALEPTAYIHVYPGTAVSKYYPKDEVCAPVMVQYYMCLCVSRLIAIGTAYIICITLGVAGPGLG